MLPGSTKWAGTERIGWSLLHAGRGMGRAFTVRELHDAAASDQPPSWG